MITYSSFFRRVICRRINQIKAPRIFTFQNFELPLGSIYHFYGENGVLGVNLNNPYIVNWSRRKANYFITQLDSLKGNPRKRVKSYRRIISRYYNTFPRMIRIRNEGALTRALTNTNYLVTIDFSLLDLGLVYLHNPMTNYYSWYNKEFTVWKRIAEIAKNTNKIHFIEIPAPTTVFDKGYLNRVSTNEFGPMFANKIITRADFMEVEMWKWISPATRRASIFHLLPEDKLDNINLVYRAKDKFAILNMGLLNKWSQAVFEDGNDAEFSEEINDEDIEASASEETGINYQWRRIIHLFFKVMNKLLQENSDKLQEKEIKESINVTDLSDDEVTGEGAEDLSDEFGDEGDLGDKSLKVNNVATNPSIDDNKKIIPFVPINITPILKEINEDIELAKIAKSKRQLNINKIEEHSSILADNIFDMNEELKQYQEEMSRAKSVVDPNIVNNFNNEVSSASLIINEVIKNKGVGRISTAQVKYLTEKTNKYKEIKNPFNNTITIGETIESESLKDVVLTPKIVKDIPLTIDKSMLKITTELSDSLYIQNQMSKDIIDVVTSVQNAGVILNDYNVERITDVMNDSEIHKLNVITPANVSSTLNITVPKIHNDGTMTVDGVRYIMKKQRVDKPIKKVNANRVSLTSYYGKLFIDRTVKVKNNYSRWLIKEIDKMIIDKSPIIKSVMYGKCTINKLNVGLSINAICENFSGFVLEDSVLNFKEAKELRDNKVLIGKTSSGEPVTIDNNQQIYYGNKEMGDIETLLGVNRNVPNVPTEYLTMKVLGSELSIGFILARYYGFYNLLKLLGVKPIRKLVKGSRYAPIVYPEYAITFADEILTFNIKDIIPAYIINGLNLFDKDIENYPVHIFDNKEVYSTIMRDNGIKAPVEVELDLLANMFIDPLCKKLLELMNEPTSFNQLLIRACELLATNQSENEINMKDMLIRGYDKVAGTMYRELVNATRSYLRKPNGSKRKLEINPRAVELSLLTDPAVAVVDELNPIQSLKEREEVTLAGTGGRSKVTITQELRGFDESDLGIISEATKDSGTVAINTFLSAAPNMNTIYGTADGLDNAEANKNPAMVLSTSALLAPFSDRED